MGIENFGRRLSVLASSTAKKAGEQVQIAKLGLDKAGIEKEIDGVFIAMGRYCYTAVKNGGTLPAELLEYCEDIDAMTAQIKELNTQIAQHKTERDAPTAAPAAEFVETQMEEEQPVEAAIKPTETDTI